jgi:hypothetical protein
MFVLIHEKFNIPLASPFGSAREFFILPLPVLRVTMADSDPSHLDQAVDDIKRALNAEPGRETASQAGTEAHHFPSQSLPSSFHGEALGTSYAHNGSVCIFFYWIGHRKAIQAQDFQLVVFCLVFSFKFPS